MDMDNVSSGLIYVIIAIVVGLFKFFKKSFSNPQKNSQSKPSKNLFEDIFSEINEKENKKEKVDTIFGEQYVPEIFNEVSSEKVEDIKASEPKVEDLKKKNSKYKAIKRIELEDFDSEKEEEVSSEFDLKRAVIYSEILNSKYC